jgi:hypothetical protein
VPLFVNIILTDLLYKVVICIYIDFLILIISNYFIIIKNTEINDDFNYSVDTLTIIFVDNHN